MLQDHTVSAIVSFYNEGTNTISVIETLEKINHVKQIICIDDGSTDDIYSVLTKKFPTIDLIRSEKNLGKSQAVKLGLAKAKYPTIFLIDADLYNLKAEEFEIALEKYFSQDIDLLLFQVYTTKAAIDGWLNKYISFTGTRILSKKNLEEVLQQPVKGYQLEAAINGFFMERHKKIMYAKCSAINPNKLDKIGFPRGFFKNIKMEIESLQYQGLTNHIHQILFFGREELK